MPIKTKLIEMPDFEEAVKEYSWNPEYNEGEVQENIYQICLKYKSYIEEAKVCRDDIVTVTCESELKKFNRTVGIRIGAGIFDKDFEKELLGKEKNKEYAYKRPDGTVKYKLTKISRLYVPAISDEIAKNENIGGVETADQLYSYFIHAKLRDALEDQAFEFLNKYTGSVKIDISDEEIEYMLEQEMERCRKISIEEHMVFDEMTEEQLLYAVGKPNIPEFKKMVRQLYRKYLTAAVCYTARQGKEVENANENEVLDLYYNFLEEAVDIALSLYENNIIGR